MEATYKEHLIQAIAPRQSDNARWMLTVIISWMEGEDNKRQRFEGPSEGFATQEAAELWGIDFGKRWINTGKPGRD
jgi:hypothetical protein